MFGIYLVIGALAGLMGGLFGIGGGVIIIPALATIFLHHSEMPANIMMQMAVGTSLATIIVTASSSMYAHHKREAVKWEIVRKMTPWLTVGAIVGAVIAHFLPSKFLQIFFSFFLIITSARMFMPHGVPDVTKVISERVFQIGSLVIGVLASILGVAGGTLLVPFLLYCQLDMREATGTSVACGMSVGIVATICFMITGLLSGVHVPDSTGYIYWPAFFGIAVASVLFAPLGATLAHTLPRDLLKRIFAVFLLIMAADMLFFRG